MKKLDVKHFLDIGFNKSQATSLAWAEIFEARQVEIEYKYQGRVDSSIRIDTFCFDCNVGGQFLPDTVRTFINRHKGHKTKTIRLK